MSRKVGIILTTIIAIIIGLWLWAGIIPKNSTQIGGSTSVNALMQLLTNDYRDSYKGDSFIYASSGSTGGVNNAKAGSYKMGFVSRAIDNSTDEVTTHFSDYDNGKYLSNGKVAASVNDNTYKDFGKEIYNYFIQENKYEANQMHYVQVATDAIILTYKAPDWFNKSFADKFDINPKGSDFAQWKSLIQKIYAGGYSWGEVATDIKGINSKATGVIPDEAYKEIITPYDREPGSGTRNSFDNLFGLSNANSGGPADTGGAPSNGVMYSDIASKAKNAFGYLSLSFIDKIKNNNSLTTVRVNGVDPKTDANFESKVNGTNGATTGYTLIRPYIGFIKWDLPKKELEKISNFLAWIATAVNEQPKGNNAENQYKGAGLKPEFNLDETIIPGAPKTPNKEVVKNNNQLNQTKLDAEKIIRAGYLPRH